MNDDDTTKRAETTDVQDWARFDAMTEDERSAAALADPDAQPLTEERLRRMTQVPRVKIIRRALGLSVEAFSARFGIPARMIDDWEARRSTPDAAAHAYLMVIAKAPDTVRDVRESGADTAASRAMSTPTVEEDKGYAFVGRFLQEFARLEQTLDAGLARLLDLTEPAQLILMDNMPIQGKINALMAIAKFEFSGSDGRELTDKDKAFGPIKRLMEVNLSRRVKMAHKPFELKDGALVFIDINSKGGKLKHRALTIKEDDFLKEIENIVIINGELQSFIDSLKRFENSLDFRDSRNAVMVALL